MWFVRQFDVTSSPGATAVVGQAPLFREKADSAHEQIVGRSRRATTSARAQADYALHISTGTTPGSST